MSLTGMATGAVREMFTDLRRDVREDHGLVIPALILVVLLGFLAVSVVGLAVWAVLAMSWLGRAVALGVVLCLRWLALWLMSPPRPRP